MAKITEIHPDLRNTLELNEHIEQVHFTKTGAHFFNVHEYVNEKGQKSGKLYGYLLTEVREVAVKGDRGKDTTMLKLVTMPNPKTEIAYTLTRDEVLELPDMEIDETQIYNPALANQKRVAKKKAAKKSDAAEINE